MKEYNPRWYIRRSPRSLAFARNLIARLNGADMVGIRDGTGENVTPGVTSGELVIRPSQRIMQLLKL